MISEQYIQQIAKGDEQAFNELVQLWYKRIYNYAWKYFAKHSEFDAHTMASEVCQKTFITVHKRLHQLQEASKFKSWLYRIATNYCNEEDRRKKRRKILSLQQFQQEEGAIKTVGWKGGDKSPELEIQRKEAGQLVRKALTEINQDQRTVLIMKEYEGLTFREIAESLEISENTAKSRMYYGLKAMRKVLEKWNINEDSVSYGN
ncbi:MAG: RNA polymerase sigma factor [Bacteroidota bacterium]